MPVEPLERLSVGRSILRRFSFKGKPEKAKKNVGFSEKPTVHVVEALSPFTSSSDFKTLKEEIQSTNIISSSPPASTPSITITEAATQPRGRHDRRKQQQLEKMGKGSPEMTRVVESPVQSWQSRSDIFLNGTSSLMNNLNLSEDSNSSMSSSDCPSPQTLVAPPASPSFMKNFKKKAEVSGVSRTVLSNCSTLDDITNQQLIDMILSSTAEEDTHATSSTSTSSASSASSSASNSVSIRSPMQKKPSKLSLFFGKSSATSDSEGEKEKQKKEENISVENNEGKNVSNDITIVEKKEGLIASIPAPRSRESPESTLRSD